VDLEGVLRDLAPRLLRYCTGRTGDPALGEDVAQESLAALVQRWRRHGPPDSPEAFVFAIARRRAGRALLKRRLLVPLAALAAHAGDAPNPEQQAVATADGRSVRAALTLLPRHDREALLLVVAGGLSTSDAARTLHISESALKMRTFRARKKLSALLEQGDGIGSRSPTGK
jgi:RNA polymerase sigma-70 factor (ECF subfamily)